MGDPERIWAILTDDGVPRSGDCFDDRIMDGLTEYIRADIVEEMVEAGHMTYEAHAEVRGDGERG